MTPQMLLDIFRKNIVRVNNPASNPATVDYVAITPNPECTGEVGHWGSGVSCGVMSLDTANQHDPGAFDTWICDYANDQIKYRTLTNQHEYCFTANMNGCTFGIGSPVQGGVVVVSHANADQLGGGDLRQQAAEQRSLTSAINPEGVRMFEPKDYNFSKGSMWMTKTGVISRLNTTTFGVLMGGQWTFWYQQYRQEGRRFLLITFKKIETNSMTTYISD